ncbi:NifY protein [Ectothiorhodospira sp. PHS-1]|uniref:nitrogen fixation protein NifX n=1 Tax=Ectothiorhodospira sp. PHS-1 TaxID=519989 RepID=UPI00024A821C|nr:nitrogen fixation protein NifX [Ectothiorhodospira sp. PHS-1]EHQ53245.1 NifY protein [Ectothiorhodospira sp. PHS-1]
MSPDILNRECALRIALASRVLPGVQLPRLIEAIIEKVDAPIREDGLARLTVADLRQALKRPKSESEEEGGPGDEALEMAVRYLSGERDVEPGLPTIEDYVPGDMADSVRIAMASNTGEKLDGHFGSCLRFLVYQVSATESRLVDIRETETADLSDDRNAARAAMVNDCQVLYIQGIGGPAAAKVIRAGVHPVKFPRGSVAAEVITQLQDVLKGSPPPWLAKSMGRQPQTLEKFRTGLEA